MENFVAEPEEPPLSSADSGAHRHQPPTPRPRPPLLPVCLVSGSIMLPGFLTAATEFICTSLVWVVCLFFFRQEHCQHKIGGFDISEYNKKLEMDYLFFLHFCSALQMRK